MENIDIVEFFKSWGLDAEDDESSIPEQVYRRMCDDAFEVGGISLRKICARLVNATDGEFYLRVHTWKEVEDVWNSI